MLCIPASELYVFKMFSWLQIFIYSEIKSRHKRTSMRIMELYHVPCLILKSWCTQTWNPTQAQDLGVFISSCDSWKGFFFCKFLSVHNGLFGIYKCSSSLTGTFWNHVISECVCWRMLVLGGWCMLVLDGVCWSMLVLDSVCWCMLDGVCWSMLVLDDWWCVLENVYCRVLGLE